MRKYGDELYIYALSMKEEDNGDKDNDAETNDKSVGSDLSDTSLVKPRKAQKGAPPPENEWQMDHIIAKVYGGTCNGGADSYRNVQIWLQSVNKEVSAALA